MLKNYFKTAWRNIRKQKIHILINVFGLAIGLCACITIYLFSRYEFSFDSFHPDGDRIYRIAGKVEESNGQSFYVEDIPPQAPSTLRKEIPGFERIAGFYRYRPKITIEKQNHERVNYDCFVEGANTSGVIIADSNYFSIFQYEWLAGDIATSLNEPFNVVLSENTARKYFGTSDWKDVIGKEVTYDDSLKVRVSGIVKDWNKNTDFPYREFISFSTIRSSFLKEEMDKNDWLPGNDNRWIWSVAKLAPGVSNDHIRSLMHGVIQKNMKLDLDTKFSLQLQPLADIHFNNDYDHDDIRKAHKPTLFGLITIAIFLLIIAVINFINLTVALSIEREKEIGIRKVMGSSNKSIIFQFLVQTFLVVQAAVVIALVISWLVFSVFKGFFPPGVTLDLFNPNTLLFILLVTTFTVLISGLYPANVLSSFVPVISLKSNPTSQKKISKRSFQKGLIVFQFTLSLIFIISSIIIMDQIRFMGYSDFKFRTDAVIIINNWDDQHGKIRVLKQQIEQLSGVEKVILQSKPPTGVTEEEPLKYKGKEEIKMLVSIQEGDENFIPFYAMKLLAGRNLRHSDSLSEFVINETFAKKLGFQAPGEAIGKLLYKENKAFPIVGVVKDFHEGSFHEAIGPLVIGHMPEREKSLAIRLAMHGKSVPSSEPLIRKIENIWSGIYPGVTFNYKFFDDIISQMYEKEQKASKLILTAMLISIIVSSLGLLGLVMFTTQIKRKEIGIRKVLGASFGNIILYISREFIILIFIAILFASPIAWYFMSHWLQDFTYRIHINWWVFVLAGLIALFIALLAICFHCIKAALANPILSIRQE
ncbi:ABC transporter permease [Agriterribacter sp.]|uniref:ABC transporter permease n=1 Tax=Agriterribacter sp. TaxID=2821509 RepID=UPI002C9EFCF6|nr:ABC transporter permease [Agriterribacter sp.]HRP57587.1 ABC transporter permease [Agriterribacter sp.]